MKKLFNKIVFKIKSAVAQVKAAFTVSRAVLASNRAEGFVDSGVKILIAVVIGALLLGGLYTLFGDTILPTLSDKIGDLFNYVG